MRLALLLGGLVLAASASAERLLFTPIGGKLRSDRIRSEVFFEGFKSASRYAWIGTGVGDSFDVEIAEQRIRGGRSRSTFDFSYNYIVPFPDYAPGISFGVMDAADQTEFGISAYGVVTWRYNQFDPWNDETPLELSIGAGTGRFRGIFVNTRIPFSNELRLLVEHDSRAITAGFELIPLRNLRAVWMVRGDQTLAGLGYSVAF